MVLPSDSRSVIVSRLAPIQEYLRSQLQEPVADYPPHFDNELVSIDDDFYPESPTFTHIACVDSLW